MGTSDLYQANDLLPAPTVGDRRSKNSKQQGINNVIENVLSSPAVSPANPFPKPEREKEQTITATSGRRCYESYKSLSRHGSSLKMLGEYLLLSGEWYSNKCALTWKMQGTKSNRLLFQLSPSMRRTDETECGLLRTPDTGMDRGPRSDENLKDRYLVRKMPLNLNGQIAMQEKNLLATPQAADATMGAVIGEQDKFRTLPSGRIRKINKNGIDGSIGLAREVAMLPTPRVGGMDAQGEKLVKKGNLSATTGKETGLKLQPNFVEWMMGYQQNWTDLNYPKPDAGSKD